MRRLRKASPRALRVISLLLKELEHAHGDSPGPSEDES